VASRNEGTADVWNAIEAHYRFLQSGPGLLDRETQRAKNELVEVLRERLLRTALEKLSQQGSHLDDLALRIARRETDPYSVADEAARL
jgi:LAO/AO transport system kinase